MTELGGYGRTCCRAAGSFTLDSVLLTLLGVRGCLQIVHQLRCSAAGYERANDFEEISCVVPFIEMAHDIGIDVNAEQVVNPR